MPPVQLPPDFTDYFNKSLSQGGSPVAVSGNGTLLIQGPNGRDTASVHVGAIFDGDRQYDNFTASLPNLQIKFYPSPVLDFKDVIDFNPNKQTFIEILVSICVTSSTLINSNTI